MNYYRMKENIGQSKVIDQLEKIFSACTLNFEQHATDFETVDIYMTATTVNGNEYYYCFEEKDREYKHDDFNSWFLEEDKFNELSDRSYYKGYKIFYVNTFTDNHITFWDLHRVKWHRVDTKYKYLPISTAEPEKGKKCKKIYCLPNDEAVWDKPFI